MVKSISAGLPAVFFAVSFVVSCVADMGPKRFRATVVVPFAVKL